MSQEAWTQEKNGLRGKGNFGPGVLTLLQRPETGVIKQADLKGEPDPDLSSACFSYEVCLH